MKIFSFIITFVLCSTITFAQVGHVMQGTGAVNMSMGGAATAQPLDISGALQWNPASISAFDGTILKFDIGAFLFISQVKVYSTPNSIIWHSLRVISSVVQQKTTEEFQPMPALAVVWGKEGSNHTFGESAFWYKWFIGVTFPQSATNPINMPQNMGGFGRIESDYILVANWLYLLVCY